MTDHEAFMRLALAQAELAGSRGEVPVGAVLVLDGRVLAAAGNTREAQCDPLGHAEINVIREGSRQLGSWRLEGCTLYVTLEPCPMCAGAILNARIRRVVYGARDAVAGCLGSKLHLYNLDFNHRPLVIPDVLAQECAAPLQAFFKDKRV